MEYANLSQTKVFFVEGSSASSKSFILQRMPMESFSHINAALMLESMTESVLITTADLRAPGPFILYVNAAFETMTGWSREEVLGKSPRLLQGPKTELGIFQDLSEKLEKGQVWHGRTVNYRKDGSEFRMEWSITPVRNEQGMIHQYLAVQKEVTEVVRMEKMLQESREAEKRRLQEIERSKRRLNKLIDTQKQTLSLFTKYVPAAIVKKALAENSTENIMISEKVEAALLFCDIRDFTAMIDGLSPDGVVKVLNVYYSFMSEVISDYNGQIIQFVGDEIFVAFGVPNSITDPEISAVHCAIAMKKRLKDINNELKEILEKAMCVGIGINFGSVIAGNLGSNDKLSYSITGSEVVVAKRIESLSRGLENIILISQSMFEKVKQVTLTENWRKIKIKGKEKKIRVYQVLEPRIKS
ncbi:MAG: PAS domain S-box protein [Saprospiraceae bacterium]|nr:PAS domain S-box protein [Saprospiraceae bacterium]